MMLLLLLSHRRGIQHTQSISLLCSAVSKSHAIPETVSVRSSIKYLFPSHAGEKEAKSLHNINGIPDSQY